MPRELVIALQKRTYCLLILKFLTTTMKSMTDNSVECIEEKHQSLTPQAQEVTNLSTQQTEQMRKLTEQMEKQTEEPQGSSMVSLLLESTLLESFITLVLM